MFYRNSVGKVGNTGLASLCFLINALSASETGSLMCRTSVLVSPLTGESLSLACPRESNQREGHPDIRPRLRRGSLLPSPLQGPAAKGHPWPIAALATSMSLNPLHGDSTRPPEGDFGVACAIAAPKPKPKPKPKQKQKTDAASLSLWKSRKLATSVPSEGRAQVLRRGTSRMDEARYRRRPHLMGQGWPIKPAPGAAPERGKLSEAKPGCRVPFFATPFLGKQRNGE